MERSCDSSNSKDGASLFGDESESSAASPLLVKDGPVHNTSLVPFGDEEVPIWTDQITFRGLLVSAVLGATFCIIIHKINFVTGVIPSLNVAAGLLGFFFIKSWTTMLSQLGIWTKPFTKQENTVIQTCVISCAGLAYSGGFGSYLLAMDETTYKIVGTDYPGNRAEDVKNPSVGWMICFLFTISFVGLLSLVPLRKVMVIDYGLTYPSGTATAILINSFHTSEGAETAHQQVKCLGKYFSISFLWSFFKWFFSGIGDSCGFDNFPSLGLEAFANKFYFDFSCTYIGVGMICPHIVNCSVLFGAILSWGILWPYIASKAGDWYPQNLENSDFKGLYGFKVFIAIALVLGDGLYNFARIAFITGIAMYKQYTNRLQLPLSADFSDNDTSRDEKRRREVFVAEGIPVWVAISGYVALASCSVVLIPQIFPAMKWYYVLVCYVVAPVLAFCNSYGAGLTDWSLGTTYGKLGLFVFASWAGSNGGVLAGLVACGVMMSIVVNASDLMQDFKTGFLTLSSPRSMFVSQIAGVAMGCVIAPATFWLFWTAFDIGSLTGEYKAPNAIIFREMAILGVAGFSALPNHCLEFCYVFFAFAIATNVFRELAPKSISQYVPIPMAIAIPFYIGAAFAIDMFIGTLIVFVWEKLNRDESNTLAPAMASGLICGDGVWTVPAAVLSVCKIEPPICMMFLPAQEAATIFG